MTSTSNEYNTGKEALIFREYGRNVQELIKYATTIEDAEYRQAFVEKIVAMILEMYPQARNEEDYRLKVWSHVQQMAKYQLNVNPPDGVPKPEEDKRPEPIPYPNRNFSYRHYGKNVKRLINKAKEMEDENKKEEFVELIGAYMKMASTAWNRDANSDENIRADIERISDGELSISEDAYLDALTNPRKRGGSNHHHHKSKRSSRNSGRSRRRKR